ncbi:MAG: glutamine--fructose-6-phosphate transaminase (isomerizing) [candidate division Zixibacteria bacterium]|nr:glutamine--fructose-6-phosphate transaminase (isomerizing) [candidate division Zixibacteria bacterium]
MCGIIGYVGNKEAMPILMDGLKRMEYRGYDSAGIAVFGDDGLQYEKYAGKIANLEEKLSGRPYKGHWGIAHTRWATHGEPNDNNAHPHLDCSGDIVLVHNGIIENYSTLREWLIRQGHQITTDTDTEILVHLIEDVYDGDLVEAVSVALARVEGTYGIAVMSRKNPDTIVAARNGSPLVVGHGNGERFVAYDVAALIRHTNHVIYLDDGEMVWITPDEFEISKIDRTTVMHDIEEVEWSLEEIEKGGFAHFMQKEIHEQPTTIINAMRGRLNREEGTARLNGIRRHLEELGQIDRVILIACGTSWHAALIGEYLIEELARIPVEVEYASEFRYRSPIIRPGTAVFVISQSGETADTLAAMREAKRKGATALGICNVVGSTIARETDGGVYIHAGPEIGVASTKAFTSQITVLTLIALLLARMRTMSMEDGIELIDAMEALPDQVKAILDREEDIQAIAADYFRSDNFLYLGRGLNFPTALEGALKLKEISYIHAEGYPAAEMKHGPIALIDERMPVVVIALRDSVYDKVINNIREVKARKGTVIAIATEGDTEITEHVDHVIYVPETLGCLTPMLSVIPLQLLAYHMAVLRRCDVDQPRNLAKSVTVE